MRLCFRSFNNYTISDIEHFFEILNKLTRLLDFEPAIQEYERFEEMVTVLTSEGYDMANLMKSVCKYYEDNHDFY